ncbi:hypothetical protein B5E82_09210 [Lachnoclostridium sp. An138]|nr:hypothetical protein B5E82_09210 [Lachnoclostridium sp. An138]
MEKCIKKGKREEAVSGGCPEGRPPGPPFSFVRQKICPAPNPGKPRKHRRSDSGFVQKQDS